MKYKFIHKIVSNALYFLIETENNNPLENFGDSDWTPEKAKQIIDGVKSTINSDKEYSWANEDIHLISNKHAVFFIDLMSMRGGGEKKKEKQDLDLPHEEFMIFMEDFKKFIEENS